VGGHRRIYEVDPGRQPGREEKINVPSLDRRLGPLDAAIIVIANVVGVGIFTTPRMLASILQNPCAILGVWIAGGALAFFGALAYAELASRHPQAGGEYVYLRESFGDLAAFLAGWTSFVAGFSGAIAAGAVGITLYLNQLIPGAVHSKIIAIGIIVILTLIHVRGLGPGRILQSALTLLKVILIIAFVVIGFASGSRNPAPLFARGAVSVSALLLAMVPVMFSYSGWNAAAYIAEELRDPTRNVPVGLATGTVAVITLYLSINALYLRVTSADRGMAVFAVHIFDVVAIVIMLSSLSAMTLAGTRVYFAMARDGAFFSVAARIHNRYRTPAFAIIAQAGWSALLVLSGTFEQLLTYTGFAVTLFSGLAVMSLFFVHGRDQNCRTFQACGYPWVPTFFCLASFAIVINAIVTAPRTAIAGLGVIIGGLPIYWWKRSTIKRNRQPRQLWTVGT
jgi:basic amino acid/polyamine antiporter, APA family